MGALRKFVTGLPRVIPKALDHPPKKDPEKVFADFLDAPRTRKEERHWSWYRRSRATAASKRLTEKLGG